MQKQKIKNQNIFGKTVLLFYIMLFSKLDKACVQNLDTIISQTKNIQARVSKYYHRESAILYPPVDTQRYKQGASGDFFLAVSRLFPEKRMLLIAQSFVGRAEKLVLVGDGPEASKIKSLSLESKNITLIQNVSEKKLLNLYKKCRATVYMPVDEDYGLVPIEGMASGKPCIAADEGGCRETVINNVTGILVKPSVSEIQKAIDIMTRKWTLDRQDTCIAQSNRFGMDVFVKGWQGLIDDKA